MPGFRPPLALTALAYFGSTLGVPALTVGGFDVVNSAPKSWAALDAFQTQWGYSWIAGLEIFLKNCVQPQMERGTHLALSRDAGDDAIVVRARFIIPQYNADLPIAPNDISYESHFHFSPTAFLVIESGNPAKIGTQNASRMTHEIAEKIVTADALPEFGRC